MQKLEDQADFIRDHIKEDKELEKRINRIELRMSWVAGIAVAVFAVWSVLSDMVLAKVGLK